MPLTYAVDKILANLDLVLMNSTAMLRTYLSKHTPDISWCGMNLQRLDVAGLEKVEERNMYAQPPFLIREDGPALRRPGRPFGAEWGHGPRTVRSVRGTPPCFMDLFF
ncbi:hypothetical protein CGCF413_v009226 [Colletotrichum fructicola]|nr:hypothetical protein CGCF413_v009226 [Colletotrichum fructicola]